MRREAKRHAAFYRIRQALKAVSPLRSATGESNLLFVPSFDGERSDAIVIGHDDDLDGIFEDTKSNWFTVESKDMAEIGNNLQMLANKLR